jgi:hypothetical protein
MAAENAIIEEAVSGGRRAFGRMQTRSGGRRFEPRGARLLSRRFAH